MLDALVPLGFLALVGITGLIWIIVLAALTSRRPQGTSTRLVLAGFLWSIGSLFVIAQLLATKTDRVNEVIFELSGASRAASQLSTVVGLGLGLVLLGQYALGYPRPPMPRLVKFGLAFWIATLLADLGSGVINTDPQFLSFPVLLVAAMLLARPDAARTAALASLPLAMISLSSLLLLLSGASWAVTRPRRLPFPGIDFRLSGLAGQHNQLGVIVATAFVASFGLPKKVRLALTPLLGLTLVLTDSRSAIYGAALAIPVLVVARRGFGVSRLALSALMVFAGVTTGLSILDQASSTDLGDASLSGRRELWSVALELFADRPFLGNGTQTFGAAFRQETGLTWAGQGHNQWIQALAQTGLVGTSAMACYIVLLGILAFRHGQRTNGLAPALFALFFVQSMSEALLWMPGFGPAMMAHAPLVLIVLGAELNQQAASDAMTDASEDQAREESSDRSDPEFGKTPVRRAFRPG